MTSSLYPLHCFPLYFHRCWSASQLTLVTTGIFTKPSILIGRHHSRNDTSRWESSGWVFLNAHCNTKCSTTGVGSGKTTVPPPQAYTKTENNLTADHELLQKEQNPTDTPVQFNFILNPCNEFPSTISTPKIFHSLTTL